MLTSRLFGDEDDEAKSVKVKELIKLLVAYSQYESSFLHDSWASQKRWALQAATASGTVSPISCLQTTVQATSDSSEPKEKTQSDDAQSFKRRLRCWCCGSSPSMLQPPHEDEVTGQAAMAACSTQYPARISALSTTTAAFYNLQYNYNCDLR